jgi:hypothetical protein
MHVPKSAGSSVRTALELVLPPGAIGPKRQDATTLCGFKEFDRLDPGVRGLLVVDPDEVSALGDHTIVSGHFSLPTLLRVAPPSAIATVVREPRARLLSHFAYWRLSTGLRQIWRGYPALDHALRPLDEFLAEPKIAQATDNLLCRMLLFGDPRIPELDFISDPKAIAAAAIEALATLGFVGVVELEEPMWRGLSDFFGAPLAPMFINTTASESIGSDAPSLELEVSAATLDLISSRTAADTIVYRHALGSAGLLPPAAKQLREAAFANELVRLGNVACLSATESRARTHEVTDLGRQLAQVQLELEQACDELSRNRVWLEGLQMSASWRITAPARAAKRAVKRLSA